MRLAGPAEKYEKMVADFSRNVGVAFQILNDIKDWDGDEDNKLVAGQDVLAGPADAAAGAGPRRARRRREREELLHLIRAGREPRTDDRRAVEPWRACATCTSQAKVFEKADKLVEKFRARAEALADEVEPTELRELLYYLVDTVLEKGPAADEEPQGVRRRTRDCRFLGRRFGVRPLRRFGVGAEWREVLRFQPGEARRRALAPSPPLRKRRGGLQTAVNPASLPGQSMIFPLVVVDPVLWPADSAAVRDSHGPRHAGALSRAIRPPTT